MDNRTLMIQLFISSAAMATIYLIYAIAQTDRLSARYFAVGFAFMSLGFVLISLQGRADAVFTVLTANAALVAGYVMFNAGMRQFLGLKALKSWHLLPLVLQLSSFVLFLYLVPQVTVRILIISFILAALNLEIALTIHRRRADLNPTMAIASMGVYFFNASYFLARILLSLPRANVPLLDPGTLTSIIFILTNLSQILMGLLFILLHSTSLERGLRSRIRQIDELNRTKDQLISIIGHDVRSPIGTISMVMSLLASRQKEGACLELDDEEFSLLNGAAQGAVNILDGLVEWGQAQQSDLGSSREPVDVITLLGQVQGQLETLADAKQVRVEIRSPGGHPPALADSRALELVMRNLLQNALKYSPQGSVIRILLEMQEKDLLLAVEDEGAGIGEEIIAALRAGQPLRSRKGTAGEKGSGLGLSLCLQLSRRMGGELEFLSPVPGTDKGTRVELRLAAVQPQGL